MSDDNSSNPTAKENALVVTEIVRNLQGGENVDAENIQNWFQDDVDSNYKLTADEILREVINEAGSITDSEDDNDGQEESTPTTVTTSEALDCIEKLIEFAEANKKFLLSNKIVLRKMRSIVKTQEAEDITLKRQKSVKDYFLLKN